ncbi:MAG TPA: S41 family peptidase [Pyrinomonadaceae bacterium]
MRREIQKRGACWCMFICALVCLLSVAPPPRLSPAVAAHGRVTETRAGRLAVFDDVSTTVRARYYDPALGGVDWRALDASLRPLAADARTQTELYAVLRRLVAPLHDAHTRVYPPGEYADWQHPRYLTTGVALREIVGALVVARVEPKSEAARGGVRVGDELLSVDGIEAATLFARRRAELGGSSTAAAARREALARLFDGPSDAPVAAVFADARGRTRAVQLQRKWAERAPAFNATRAGAYAIVAFNTFTPQIALALTRALHTDLARARGLVLDLRDNGGGDAEAMTDIASAFLPPGTSLGSFTDRAGQVTAAPQTRTALLLAADEAARFRGPLVVLVSTRTASAAEVFVAALKERGRALLVGEATCGCVLGIRRRHTLPDGGALDLSELDYHTAAGTRLEGAGLAPDELLAPTRDDLSKGRDPVVARALELRKTR